MSLDGLIDFYVMDQFFESIFESVIVLISGNDCLEKIKAEGLSISFNACLQESKVSLLSAGLNTFKLGIDLKLIN